MSTLRNLLSYGSIAFCDTFVIHWWYVNDTYHQRFWRHTPVTLLIHVCYGATIQHWYSIICNHSLTTDTLPIRYRYAIDTLAIHYRYTTYTSQWSRDIHGISMLNLHACMPDKTSWAHGEQQRRRLRDAYHACIRWEYHACITRVSRVYLRCSVWCIYDTVSVLYWYRITNLSLPAGGCVFWPGNDTPRLQYHGCIHMYPLWCMITCLVMYDTAKTLL